MDGNNHKLKSTPNHGAKRSDVSFVKLYRLEKEEIFDKKLDLEEFGFLNFLRLSADFRRGYLRENYSTLAQRLGIAPDKVRYLCQKLRRIGKIWYRLRQGQRCIPKIYLLGFEKVGGLAVTMESIKDEEAECSHQNFSEVKVRIPKSISTPTPHLEMDFALPTFSNSEVLYKKNKKENKKKKSLKDISSETLKDLQEKFGEEGLKTYLERLGYPSDEIKIASQKLVKN